ncbi:hybrid sensor histidine kinase/response regulator [Halosolutus gelatinilyticus]|uniref:hybrid sensor histidine kinase/response regulator n=1 Tax=Halosolutus gelatinilyticus TaxID=2931975 RepID=UPI001FF69DF8|nr:response regulator [Halosolutus gelatinilyticus]
MKTVSSDQYAVLLAEDDEDQTWLYRAMMNQTTAIEGAVPSFATETAGTLEEVTAALGDADPAVDLVLLDLNLPDSSGLETLEAVLDETDVPVVVLTAMDNDTIGRTAVERGAQDFLVKDHVTPRLLTQTVIYAIERTRQLAELKRQRRELAVLNWLIRHEIRDDAAVVLGWAAGLSPSDPGEERIVSRIVEASDHIVGLTESVGAFVQALEKPDGDLTSVDLASVLREEVDRLEQRHPDVAVALEGADDAVTVRADRFLTAVVRTLLSNAVGHADDESPEVEIAFVTDEREDRTTGGDPLLGIAVSDNGSPSSSRPRRSAADRDFTATEFDDDAELYLVHLFVDRYGGRLEVERDRAGRPTARVLLEPGD